MIPPKPAVRTGRVSFLNYLRLFRRDNLSAHPPHLFRAWMAEFRTPFFRNFLVNDPALIRRVLKEEPGDFPKSRRLAEGLRPLLGNSVFLSDGAVWARQRRIIDPAFDGGRLGDSLPAMLAAAEAAAARLSPGAHDIEEPASHAAADVIFRTLFSVPIEDAAAAAVYAAFQRYQRAQPLLNLAALLPLPRWAPRGLPRQARAAVREIRGLIATMVERRAAEIAAGTAPDDLANRIMTTPDPETGERFAPAEMADQVAIFFLAGHETSASALAWALYLIACDPGLQSRVAAEGARFRAERRLSLLSETTRVFRETLRLYPPVPMMVREAKAPARFRDRTVPEGAQITVSQWHLHRHERLWSDPDAFRPGRWASPPPPGAYLPFSAGPRVCPGAGFAMAEGAILLAVLAAGWQFAPIDGDTPVPAARLTLRSRDGIRLRLSRRAG